MIRNKLFVKFICVLLLASFLTFSVGKEQRASAIGTTVAVSAAAALCAVGIVYCSYMALTGAAVHIPDTAENIESWLSDMGTKVVQFPSGREAYEELYTYNLGHSPEGDLIRDFINSEVWTWTAEKLKSWANDFSSTNVISSIAGTYTISPDYSTIPLNGYDYPFTINPLPNYYQYNGQQVLTLDEFMSYGWSVSIGAGGRSIMKDQMIVPTNYTQEVRNYKRAIDGKFLPQYYDGTYWRDIGIFSYYSGHYIWTDTGDTFTCVPNDSYWVDGTSTISGSLVFDYPFFPNDTIYDEETGEYSVVITPTDIVSDNVQWPVGPLPPDQDNKPLVIPYLQLPFDPNWYDPISGLPGGGNWGLRLGDLLDKLEELANLMIEIGAIGELINEFKDLITGQTGDDYYIYYDDSTHNYYEYYTITNLGDTIYNYDINVSNTEEHLPVDLNTIRTYSSNRYVDTFKRVADSGSSIIGDLVVFWHNVDPDIIYTLFGCAIITLIAAFIGKWGHS